MRTTRLDVEDHGVTPVEARLQRFFDGATLIAAWATVPVVVALGTGLGDTARTALEVVNWLLWAPFALELVVMPAVTRDRGRWLRHHPMSIAIPVLTVPIFGGLALIRLVRLLRGPVARRAANAATSQEGLRNLALLTLLTVGLSGVLFGLVEPQVSTSDGIYWAVQTVTTVGYGDVVPTTSTGRVLAIYVMLVGVGFLAILTGAIAQRFMSRWRDFPAEEPAGQGHQDAVLAKLDELGERIAALERAVTRERG